MIATRLAAAAALLGLGFVTPQEASLESGIHTEWHPADASAWMHVPDLAALSDAWSQTALGRMLADESVRAALAKTLGKEEFDPAEALAAWYANAVAESELPPVVELLWKPLRSLSMSVVVPETFEAAFSLEGIGLATVLSFESDAASAAYLDGFASMLESSGVRSLREGAEVVHLFGEASEEAQRARMSESAKGLSAAAVQRKGASSTDGGGAVVLELWSTIDLARLGYEGAAIGRLAFDLLEGVFGTTGTMLAHGGRWTIRLANGRYVTDGVQPPSDGPYSDVIGSAPLAAAAREAFHPESVLAFATHFDPAALVRGIREESPDEDPFVEMESETGVRLDRDLLAPLGDWISVSMPPPRGFMSAPHVQLCVGLTSRDTFLPGLGLLLEALAAQVTEVSIERDAYRDVPLVTITIASSGVSELPIDPATLFRPTFAIFEDEVLLTTLPTHAKREVRRRLEAAEAAAEGTTAEPAAGSLARLAPPSGASEIGYADWGGLAATLYGSVRVMAPMLAGGADLPFDPSALPDAAVFTRFFEPTVRWERRSAEGTLHHSESSFGPEWQILPAIAAGVAPLVRSRMAPPPPAVPPPPAEEGAESSGDE